MKIGTVITMSILAAMLPVAPLAFSQPPGGPGKDAKQHKRGPLANLSAEEQQKFEATRKKAMQDPSVQSAKEKMRQARKELHDAMYAAMVKADPSVKSILDKMPAPPEREGDVHPPRDRD
jgi:Spy/CpxP family protein refolding chaperone